jgi:hypothetical protein
VSFAGNEQELDGVGCSELGVMERVGCSELGVMEGIGCSELE